jgi:hypothetical protein
MHFGRGLFINNKKAQDSIYESGLMVFNCIKGSAKFELDYIEISKEDRILKTGYDFYFFNYHPSTMAWLDTSKLKSLSAPVLTMVLEVLPNDPFVLSPDTHFHGYCVLDPTIKTKGKVFAFPRPLEEMKVLPYVEKEVPVIGSFGFATKGKGFQHVIEAVNTEFDQGVVRINIPYGDFVPQSKEYAFYLANLCKEKAKPGIEVRVTHDYMSKEELIEWCAQNTLNCFLYDRNLPGLAATTDQAIVSGRPLAISKNETFRHILAYLSPYPQLSLKESIRSSIPIVEKMQRDWSPASFQRKFEIMLEQLSNKYKKRHSTTNRFELPILKGTFLETIQKKYRKYKRFLSPEKLSYALKQRRAKNEKLI